MDENELLDEDGHLCNLKDWNRDVASSIAEREGIRMTDIRWGIVDLVRDHCQRYQVAPPVKMLAKEIKQRFGHQRWSDNYLDGLYLAGPTERLCKIAGLPRFTGSIENAAVFGGGSDLRCSTNKEVEYALHSK